LRILLDTHAFLWFLSGDPKLSGHGRQLIEDPGNERLLSVASLWEIAIKISLGKLAVTGTFEEVFPPQIETNAIQILPIEASHLDVVSRLPFLHRDPFDRLIIAQAMVEGIPLLSRDPAFDEYAVTRVWGAPAT
jgi:PIN domain nuclease of toxin-antitoxin system